MKENDTFSTFEDNGNGAKKMVEIRYYGAFSLLYCVIKLILVLPVATATVEWAFLAMKIIMTNLRNTLNNSLMCFIERHVFKRITSDAIM